MATENIAASKTAKVSISPNPFSNEVNFSFKGLKGATQVRIFNASGQEILRQNLELQGQQNEID